MVLYEGYLGVLLCLNLFRYDFTVQWEKSGRAPTDINYAGFRLRDNRFDKYLPSWVPCTHSKNSPRSWPR